jgi:citronellol/citronellal dehydrogenase
VANSPGGARLLAASRSPEIIGDAAVEILYQPRAVVNGRCPIGSELLAKTGVTDLFPLRRRQADSRHLR